MSHAKCYLVSKAHKTQFQLVCLCFGGSPFLMAVTLMSLGDAITPEINMATEKRKQQLELHSSYTLQCRPYTISLSLR